MEDLERYGDDNDLDEEELGEGKKSAFGIFFKILVAVCCIFVVGVLGYRIFLSEYTPAAMKNIAYTDTVREHYLATGGNLGAKTQKLRFSYDDEDRGTFFAEGLIIIPDINHLQITHIHHTSTASVFTFGVSYISSSIRFASASPCAAAFRNQNSALS